MKQDERLVKTNEHTAQMLNLSTFPNFHESGSIEGMRNLFYGKDAYLVHSGHYIYHVDEDTFHAVKDSNYIQTQPTWLNDINTRLTNSFIESYKDSLITPKDHQLQAEKEALYRKTFDEAGLSQFTTEEICRIASGHAPHNTPANLSEFNKATITVRAYERGFAEKFQQNHHEFTVMSLATQAEMMQKLKARINKAVTNVRLNGTDGAGHVLIAARMDGKDIPDTRVTPDEVQELKDLPVTELHPKLVELVAKHNADKLFAPVAKEAQSLLEDTNPLKQSTADIMDDSHILETADKISVVLEKFYSLHEADELTRVITDPESTVDDVKATMADIAQRNRLADEREAAEARITSATFLFPDDKNVTLMINIDGHRMPVRNLNDSDAAMIRGVDLSKLSEGEIEDMARDLAVTYYDDMLKAQPHELAAMLHGDELHLTPGDARTFDDLQQALERKFPNGVTLGVNDFSSDELFSYVHYGNFRDEDLSLAPLGQTLSTDDDHLQAELRLPQDKLSRLSASQLYYCNEEYEDFINGLDNGEAFDASTTELMHTHPDLDGAHLVTYDQNLPKYLHIEGHTLDTCIAWILQHPTISTDELKTVLKNPIEAKRLLEQVRTAELSDYDRNRIAKMNLPAGMDMVSNRDRIYMYERGTLGFAEVDRMRGVRYSGETMSRTAQDFINDFACNKNIVSRGNHTFFMMPAAGAERRVYLDTMKDKLVNIDIQKDIYGNTLHTDSIKVLNEGDMQHFQDITGRITHATIVGIDKPMVRCKIDGVQQSGELLTKAERISMAHFESGSEDMKKFELSMAAKHFATALYSEQQSRNKGVGR